MTKTKAQRVNIALLLLLAVWLGQTLGLMFPLRWS